MRGAAQGGLGGVRSLVSAMLEFQRLTRHPHGNAGQRTGKYRTRVRGRGLDGDIKKLGDVSLKLIFSHKTSILGL